jgi:uncharacterized protein (TIGR02147 family)
MMTSHDFLNVFYQRKKTRNQNLSLRAMARIMGISPSYFSEILNGKKNIPTHKLKNILETLDIDDFAALYLKNCLRQEGHRDYSISDEDFLDLYRDFNEDDFNIFKEWFYVPLMELTTLSNFINDNTWMAKKLGISEAEVGVAIFHLKKAKYLTNENGKLTKTDKQLIYKVKNPQKRAQTYHKNMILKGTEQFERNTQQDFERRAISSYTLAVNPEILNDVMKKLKEDVLTSASIASQGDCTEVYQLNLQFYPLTSSNGETALQ